MNFYYIYIIKTSTLKLHNMKIRIFICLLFSFFSIACFAQETTVTGKVTRSCDSKPLPNVRVGAENGDASTTTDYEGNFTIIVDKKDVLTFTKFAYQRRTVKNEDAKSVSLELDDMEIDGIEDLLENLNDMINKLRRENMQLGKPKPCPPCPSCPSAESK